MAYSFYLYTDAGLTTQHVGDIPMTQTFDGSDPLPNRQFVYFFGSQIDGRVGQARSNPGTDPVEAKLTSLINPWVQSTVYNVGNQVHATAKNNRLYQVITVQGDQTSGATEPDFASNATIGDTVVDNNVTWRCEDHMNHPENMRLADTQAGLAGATPGAPLNLGTAVTGGVANAKQVHIQWDDATGLEGSRSRIALEFTELVESTGT